jgi:hypothetical protein
VAPETESLSERAQHCRCVEKGDSKSHDQLSLLFNKLWLWWLTDGDEWVLVDNISNRVYSMFVKRPDCLLLTITGSLTLPR